MQLKGGSIVVALAILGHAAAACENDLSYLPVQSFTGAPCRGRFARVQDSRAPDTG